MQKLDKYGKLIIAYIKDDKLTVDDEVMIEFEKYRKDLYKAFSSI